MNKYPIDYIYLAACRRDAKLTRICVASIRYFYPDVPIRLLAGDIIQPGLAHELKKYWNVGLHNIKKADYGWGFVKMEPLFGPKGERFLVMDVDTIFTGFVLQLREASNAPFLVDNEPHTDEEFKRLYFDWDRLRAIDPDVQSARMAFSGGQWFGTAGYVTRSEFDKWLEWSYPRKQKFQEYFFGGEQGVVSYVLTKKEVFEGLKVDRTTIMRWPGNETNLEDLKLTDVKNRTAPPFVIHWAGMKSIFISKMTGADLLLFFEDYYYQRIPFRKIKRLVDYSIHVLIHVKYTAVITLKIKMRSLLERRSRQIPDLQNQLN